MSGSKRPKNALSHGAYARDVVLAWENEEEFNDLHQGLREEFCPTGRSEEAAVFDLACWHWKKRRLSVGSQLAFHHHPDAGALGEAGRDGWKGVAKHLASQVGDGNRVCDGFRAMAKTHAATAGKVYGLIGQMADRISAGDAADPVGKQNDSAELEKLIALGKELNVVNKELIVPTLRMIENYDLDQKVCERAYRPEIMERELKIHAEIDKRIEKTINRLVTIKEYKKFYGAKAVEAQANEVVINLSAKRHRNSGGD